MTQPYFSASTHKAIKRHQCDLCSRWIEPGETYNRQRGIGEDGPFTFKECAACRWLVGLINSEFGRDWYDQERGYTEDDIADLPRNCGTLLYPVLAAALAAWPNHEPPSPR